MAKWVVPLVGARCAGAAVAAYFRWYHREDMVFCVMRAGKSPTVGRVWKTSRPQAPEADGAVTTLTYSSAPHFTKATTGTRSTKMYVDGLGRTKKAESGYVQGGSAR